MNKRTKHKFDVSEIKRYFNYDPETGLVTWKETTGKRVKVGSIAGSSNSKGHRVIMFKGEHLMTSTVIWIIMVGKYPTNLIRHINGNNEDYSWDNLEELTQSNIFHSHGCFRKLNKSGFRGVSKHGNGYRGALLLNRIKKYTNVYPTAEDANEALSSLRQGLLGKIIK